jgi:hypothetical protein
MKTDKSIHTTDSKLSIEDQKAIEVINLHFKFRQNMSKIRSHFGF